MIVLGLMVQITISKYHRSSDLICPMQTMLQTLKYGELSEKWTFISHSLSSPQINSCDESQHACSINVMMQNKYEHDIFHEIWHSKWIKYAMDCITFESHGSYYCITFMWPRQPEQWVNNIHWIFIFRIYSSSYIDVIHPIPIRHSLFVCVCII